MESTVLSKCYYPSVERFKHQSIFEDRQVESERAETFYISKNQRDYKTKIYDIDNFMIPDYLKISNLSLREAKNLQNYRYRCSKTKYDKMCNARKYIIDAYHFNYSTQDHNYSKTHFYCVAPSLKSHNLPTIYRFSVCHDMDEPKHYSFSLYADCGGYADGFYFLGRMDHDISQRAHKVTNPIIKSEQQLNAYYANLPKEEVCFPHIHKVKKFSYDTNKKEDVKPLGLKELENFDEKTHLIYFMSLFKIDKQLYLMDINTKLKDVLRTFEKQGIDKILQRYGADEFNKYMSYHESKQHIDGLPFQKEIKASYIQRR